MSKKKNKPRMKKVAECVSAVKYAPKKGNCVAKQESGGFPWESLGARNDVLKSFNLRFPEPYLIKLRYIAEHTPNSMNKFCVTVLTRAIDEKIKALTK